MASYGDETKQYHRERIREILVLKPNASVRAIRQALDADPSSPLTLDPVYIGKHVRAIRTERSTRYVRPDMMQTIAELEDKTESVVEQMWRIVLDPKLDERARVQAGKLIVDSQHSLLESKMNAGIYERKLGTVAVEHTHEHIVKLPPEIKAGILQAFKSYGIIRDAKYTVLPAAPAANGGAA